MLVLDFLGIYTSHKSLCESLGEFYHQQLYCTIIIKSHHTTASSPPYYCQQFIILMLKGHHTTAMQQSTILLLVVHHTTASSPRYYCQQSTIVLLVVVHLLILISPPEGDGNTHRTCTMPSIRYCIGQQAVILVYKHKTMKYRVRQRGSSLFHSARPLFRFSTPKKSDP